MTEIQFVRIVEDACESALISVGFKRLRRGTIVHEISAAFWGWVGLNKGIHGDMIRINPFVGVHAVEVMKLCAQLENSKYVKGAYATYAIHLGELLPEAPTFEFHREVAVDEEAGRLAACIVEAGLNYMRSISSYEVLLPLIATRMPMLGGYPERYAAALYLSGKPEIACDFVRGVLNSGGELAKFASPSFTRFGENFLEMNQGGVHGLKRSGDPGGSTA